MSRAVPVVLAASAVLLTGCGGPAVVCPAIAYGSTLVVRLAADWPAGPDRTVQVDCDSPCELVPPTSSPVPVTGAGARVGMLDPPDSVMVTVLDPSGPLTSVEDELTWKRIGGSAECGGPMEASVTVPAP